MYGASMKTKRRSQAGNEAKRPKKAQGGNRRGFSGDCRLEAADDSEVDVLFHGFFVWVVIIQSAGRNTQHNIKKATLPESPLMSTFTFT
jgi:hypothetical protein